MQHDLDIANQLFPATRADMNSAFQALGSNNSGAAFPATIFANMFHFNETDDTLYIRSEDNTTWLPVFKVVGGQIIPYISGAQLGQATTAVKGIGELATGAEAAALTDPDRLVTPLALASVLATEAAFGLSRYATLAEIETFLVDRGISAVQLGRLWKEGTAIASAATIAKPSDVNRGRVYSLTGVTTVTAIYTGAPAGMKIGFRIATGPIQFTNSATLIIPGGTRSFVAGDWIEFTAEAGNVWRLTSYSLANGKALVETAAPADKFSSALLHVQDQKSSGTNGGASTNTFVKRTLNTVLTNEIGATVVSDVVTLLAGTYFLEASCPADSINSHKAKWRNTSDSSDVLWGTTEENSASNNVVSRSWVSGRFTIAATKSFELQHIADTVLASFGWGRAGSLGTEVYSDLKIWKVA